MQVKILPYVSPSASKDEWFHNLEPLKLENVLITKLG